MRLLMLNHNLRGRGTWHRAWQLARELARRGHAVTIWSAAPHHYYRPCREIVDGVSILETPSWAPLAGADDGWGPLDALYRAGRVLVEPFDLCYAFAHPPNVALPAWLARRVRRRPLLYDWCDWYEGGIFPKRQAARREDLTRDEAWMQSFAERREIALERGMARLAGRLTVISERLCELALAAGRQAGEIMLLPNGADLDGIRPLDAARCRAELGLPDGHLWLGYVANYHPDQQLLLGALARAARAHPSLRLLKTGPPFSERLVRDLGLAPCIHDLGFVEFARIPLVLGAADVLVLPLEDNPSNRARVPFKFTDYLAAGRPVVSCLVGDLRRWFAPAPGEPPIGLAGAATPDALGEAMARTLDPAQAGARAAMGAAARALAEREFTWPALVDRLELFLAAWLGDATVTRRVDDARG